MLHRYENFSWGKFWRRNRRLLVALFIVSWGFFIFRAVIIDTADAFDHSENPEIQIEDETWSDTDFEIDEFEKENLLEKEFANVGDNLLDFDIEIKDVNESPTKPLGLNERRKKRRAFYSKAHVVREWLTKKRVLEARKSSPLPSPQTFQPVEHAHKHSSSPRRSYSGPAANI